MARLALLLALTLAASVRAQDAALDEARALLLRAERPFERRTDAEACALGLVRSLTAAREAALRAVDRPAAADALNHEVFRAVLGRASSTRGLNKSIDLVGLDQGLSLLDLRHLGRHARSVEECLVRLHRLARQPVREPDVDDRSFVEADLFGTEARLRAMLHDPVAAPAPQPDGRTLLVNGRLR